MGKLKGKKAWRKHIDTTDVSVVMRCVYRQEGGKSDL
jgi:hypothetical protein